MVGNLELVFSGFNRLRQMTPINHFLSNRTGMGFGTGSLCHSNAKTNCKGQTSFIASIQTIEVSGVDFSQLVTEISFKVIADHVRAVSSQSVMGALTINKRTVAISTSSHSCGVMHGRKLGVAP